jgi:hypothetical protein
VKWFSLLILLLPGACIPYEEGATLEPGKATISQTQAQKPALLPLMLTGLLGLKLSLNDVAAEATVTARGSQAQCKACLQMAHCV